MAFQLKFVDSIAASPTTRLDLNDGTNISTKGDGTEFGLPELDRAFADTLLADGAEVPASAYGNRVITLRLDFEGATGDAAALRWQSVVKELNRPTNILMYQPLGTTNPVFFQTLRSAPASWDFDPLAAMATVRILAKPFALGTKQTLSAVTVYNDPNEGTTANSNPFFETNASGWNVSGATFVRSTAQFHEGAASGLCTPDGVSANSVVETSPIVSTTPGAVWRVSAWMRCASARSVSIQTRWFDSGNAFLSQTQQTISVAANTWTYFDLVATAPASTAGVRLGCVMSSTPPASDLLYIDEARLRLANTVGGQCFEVTGVIGDVETPLFLSTPRFGPGGGSTTGNTSCIATRRRGTPSAAPFLLQAESLTLSTDTTLPGNDTAMSPYTGNNYARTSFATSANMVQRLVTSNATWIAASVDVRGKYRVFARTRHSVSGDVIQMRLRYYLNGGGTVDNTSVTLSSSTLIRYADLGYITFPSGSDPVTDGYSGTELTASALSVEIQASRGGGGSGNLDIDFLLFIPADDRHALVTWGLTGGPDTFILDSARNAAYSTLSGAIYGDPSYPVVGGAPYVSPNVTNRVYFVRNVNTTDTTTDALTSTSVVTPYYWPRYLAVRPVST